MDKGVPQRVGYLCNLLGRTDACRIVAHEVGPGRDDQPVDWWLVETEDGQTRVESWQITNVWAPVDECKEYEPPASRLGIIKGIEVTGDDSRPWNMRVGNTMP